MPESLCGELGLDSKVRRRRGAFGRPEGCKRGTSGGAPEWSNQFKTGRDKENMIGEAERSFQINHFFYDIQKIEQKYAQSRVEA